VRILAAAVAGPVLAVLAAAPAIAHPFGEPQTVVVSATADGVRVAWSAEQDDVTALAVHLGVVGGSHVMLFEDGEYVAEGSSVPAGVRLAEESDVLESYLLAQVGVTADGAACAGALEPVSDVELDGAAVEFDCGGPVGTVDVRVATLVDLDPRYRILATGPAGQRHVYTSEHGTSAWVLGDEPAPEGAASVAASSTPSAGRSAAVQLGGISGAVALLGLGAWGLRRRRSSRG
jgi:hypothetical protein